MRRMMALAFVATIVFAAKARVVINEIQSSNDETCMDEFGENPDWVELYNDGDEDVDISGWGLSDKEKSPFQWTFPANTVIAARSYLRVFADGGSRSSDVQDVTTLSPDDEQVLDSLVTWTTGDAALADYGNKGSVACWRDLSRGNSATNETVSQRPSVLGDSLNGHAVLNFDLSKNSRLFLPLNDFDGLQSMSNVTVMIVANWGGRMKTATMRGGLYGVYASPATYDCKFEFSGKGTLTIRNGRSANTASVTVGEAINNWNVYGFSTDSMRESQLTRMFVNNSMVAKTSQDTGPCGFGSMTSGKHAIGNTDAGNSRAFDGQIAEVLIFNRALTDKEYAGVYQYLRDKYALHQSQNLHAAFSLSASGESVYLTSKESGQLEDSLTFGTVPCDTSFGRVGGSGSSLGYFAEPTPGVENSAVSYSAPLGPVTFSKARGVYSEAFSVELSSEDPEATIKYTLDHSDPSAANGFVYTNGIPILIEQTTVLKATAVKDGALPCRNVVANTYIFIDDVFSAQNPKRLHLLGLTVARRRRLIR